MAGKYLLRRITEIRDALDELESYFRGFNINPPDLASQSSNVTLHYDQSSNSYVSTVNEDPDAIIDLIENNRIKKPHTNDLASHNQEVIEMPKLKEGNICKRKDGRWMARYNNNGKQISLYAKTQIECKEKLVSAIKARDEAEKESSISKKITLNAWIDQWIDIYKKPKLKVSSLQLIEQSLRPALVNGIGKKEVTQLTPMDIQKTLNQVKFQTTRMRVYVYLNECLNVLVNNRILKYNVCSTIEKPRVATVKQHIVLSPSEMDAFLERIKAFSPTCHLMAKFIASTGLRRGEFLALTWNDVDFEKKTIVINKAFDQRTKSNTSPKSRTSNRTIPLFEPAIDVLQQIEHKGSEIFDFIGKTHISHLFTDTARHAGYSGLSLHDLRHHFATRCLEAGIERKIVQTWLGHAKYEITVNTYSHINRDFMCAEVDKMATFLKKRR